MSKQNRIKLSDWKEYLQHYGVDLSQYQLGSDVQQPSSARDWMQVIATKITSHTSTVFDLKITEKSAQKENALRVNDLFVVIDAAHYWAVNHAYAQLKPIVNKGSMYEFDGKSLKLNTDNNAMFSAYDAFTEYEWISSYAVPNADNTDYDIAENAEPKPHTPSITPSGIEISYDEAQIQHILTFLQWMQQTAEYQVNGTYNPEQYHVDYAVTQEYLNIAAKMLLAIPYVNYHQVSVHYVDADLFIPQQVNNINWKYYWFYREDRENDFVSDGNNKDGEENIKSSTIWEFFNGTHPLAEDIERIEKDIEKISSKQNDPEFFENSLYNDLERAEKELSLAIGTIQIKAIYNKIPEYFRPLLRFSNYYGVNGDRFKIQGLHTLFYHPLFIRNTRKPSNDAVEIYGRSLWTPQELKERSVLLQSKAKLLQSFIPENYESRDEAQQNAWYAVTQAVELFEFLSIVLICMTEDDYATCDVCFRAKVNRERCAYHKTINQETSEVRWARKIMDDYLLRLKLHQKECLYFYKQLVQEPVNFLKDISEQHPTLDSTLVHSFQQLNCFLPSPLQLDYSKINTETLDEFRLFSCQLRALQALLLRPLDEKWNQLYALMVWEYVTLYNHHKDARYVSTVKWIQKIYLKIFIKVWFKGVLNFGSRPIIKRKKSDDSNAIVEVRLFSSPQITELIKHGQFDWLRNGFDPYSNVVKQMDDFDTWTNYYIDMHEFVQFLIRQSAWMNVDFLLKNDTTVAKFRQDRVLELYEQGLSLSDIGVEMSPENPLSVDIVRTTLYRVMAKKIQKEELIKGLKAISATHQVDIDALLELDAPTKKLLGKALGEVLNLKMPVLSGAVTLAIDNYIKTTAKQKRKSKTSA